MRKSTRRRILKFDGAAQLVSEARDPAETKVRKIELRTRRSLHRTRLPFQSQRYHTALLDSTAQVNAVRRHWSHPFSRLETNRTMDKESAERSSSEEDRRLAREGTDMSQKGTRRESQ